MTAISTRIHSRDSRDGAGHFNGADALGAGNLTMSTVPNGERDVRMRSMHIWPASPALRATRDVPPARPQPRARPIGRARCWARIGCQALLTAAIIALPTTPEWARAFVPPGPARASTPRTLIVPAPAPGARAMPPRIDLPRHAADAMRDRSSAAVNAAEANGRRDPCRPDDVQRFSYQVGTPYCEVRTLTLTPTEALTVDASRHSGDVAVQGDASRTVRVEAVVVTWATSAELAQRIATEVHVTSDGDVLRATGFPERAEGTDRRYWSVSYRVVVPRRCDLTIRAYNGSIDLRGVSGHLRAEAHNGRVTLDDVGGAVAVQSNNGDVTAELTGRTWDTGGLAGAGLDLVANSGDATLRVPGDYAARIRVSSNSGAVASDFPADRREGASELEATLGGGGPALRVYTNNGRAQLSRARQR